MLASKPDFVTLFLLAHFMFQSDLPDKFYRVRKFLDWPQAYMAAEMNITPEAYGKIERGKTRITEERLNQIASVFGFHAHEMLQLSAEELLSLLMARKNPPPPQLR